MTAFRSGIAREVESFAGAAALSTADRERIAAVVRTSDDRAALFACADELERDALINLACDNAARAQYGLGLARRVRAASEEGHLAEPVRPEGRRMK